MNVEALKSILDGIIVRPDLFPLYSENGTLMTTYCNLAARLAAQACGLKDFDDASLMADDMYKILSTINDGRIKKVDGMTACTHAMIGALGFACASGPMLGEAHGHIAAIFPAPLQGSGSLGHSVPMLANVGRGNPAIDLYKNSAGILTRPNWVCKSSQAFPVSIAGQPFEAPYFIFV